MAAQSGTCENGGVMIRSLKYCRDTNGSEACACNTCAAAAPASASGCATTVVAHGHGRHGAHACVSNYKASSDPQVHMYGCALVLALRSLEVLQPQLRLRHGGAAAPVDQIEKPEARVQSAACRAQQHCSPAGDFKCCYRLPKELSAFRSLIDAGGSTGEWRQHSARRTKPVLPCCRQIEGVSVNRHHFGSLELSPSKC